MMAEPQSYLSGQSTQSDITVEVNYSTGVDPDPDTVFYGQVDVDRFLYEKGATGLKHLIALWDALPPLIKHDITVNLSEEDHLPRPTDTRYGAWDMTGKLFVGGTITLNGGLPSTYIPVDASLEDLVPVSTQTGSYDPYMTFSGTPFASFDLHGQFVVFDTGQVTIIHDHDDSTLYFIDELSPTPSSVTVARPSTRFLNDNGSGGQFKGVGIFIQHGARNSIGTHLTINDLCIAPYGGHAVYFTEVGSALTRVLLDNTVGPSEGGIGAFIVGFNSVNSFTCFSRISTLGSTAPYWPVALQHQGTAVLYTCYFRGGDYGIKVNYDRGSSLRAFGLILDGVGTNSVLEYDRGSLWVCGPQLRLDASGNGKRNEIRNGTTYGLVLRDGGFVRGPSHPIAVFKNISAPCVVVGNTGILDLVYSSNNKFLNGGGNTDVGIQVEGPSAEVKLTTDTDVSGSVGDVRMADGTILSYSYINSNGPVIDFFHNIIEVT